VRRIGRIKCCVIDIGSSRDRVKSRCPKNFTSSHWRLKRSVFFVIQNSKRIMTFLFLDYYLHFEIAKIILPFNLKWTPISNNHRHVPVFSGCILELALTLSNWVGIHKTSYANLYFFFFNF